MKKLFIILGLSLLISLLFSEEIVINNTDFQVNVISSNDMETTIEYNFGKFERTHTLSSWSGKRSFNF
jgi:hypothetical protein